MGVHLIDNEFQSDKYPTTPRGKVPLSVKDPMAQDLLWEYAQRRRSVDAEFSEDLEVALKNAGFVPPKLRMQPGEFFVDCFAALSWCAGASDFQTGGIAERGWARVVEPVLAKLRAALK
jgi:hypothetical protein